MGTEMSKSSNSISFIDLPTVVQREIFKMLKPWDLLHMDGYYYPGDTVIIQRKDGFFAVVTIATLQTDLNLFAFVVVAT
uniref:Uncharacterized protein n=1 Tax=Caenorhabditis japonica TaxID=281687 RepID=A0A8R1DS83_CAEJA